MRNIQIFLAILFATISIAFAQKAPHVPSWKIYENNGEKTVRFVGVDGRKISYIYKNNILIGRRYRNSKITYTFDSKKQIAYGTTSKGKIYTISRDRHGRILMISGIGSALLEAKYANDSPTPFQVTLTTKKGRVLAPQFFTATTPVVANRTLSQDTKITSMYETVAFAGPLEWEPCDSCGEEGGGGNDPSDPGDPDDPSDPSDPSDPDDPGYCDDSVIVAQPAGAKIDIASAQRSISTSIHANGVVGACRVPDPVCTSDCDNNYYNGDIPRCQRLYPGTSNTAQGQRAVCYNIAAQNLGTCLAGC